MFIAKIIILNIAFFSMRAYSKDDEEWFTSC